MDLSGDRTKCVSKEHGPQLISSEDPPTLPHWLTEQGLVNGCAAPGFIVRFDWPLTILD